VDNITKADHARLMETLTEANNTMKINDRRSAPESVQAEAGRSKFLVAVMGFCVVNFQVKPEKDALAELVFVYKQQGLGRVAKKFS
jgi:hypothetical protein